MPGIGLKRIPKTGELVQVTAWDIGGLMNQMVLGRVLGMQQGKIRVWRVGVEKREDADLYDTWQLAELRSQRLTRI
ncbi:hypothetical protein [Verrucomicrobium spinosum]|uniref:hypothetical protein n=1 Tax=Verrucomicrobium spinosum TaxID=2736 RepID=UPI00094628EF|nr:hypothetical protein [Verrucomicrobium spinosum]